MGMKRAKDFSQRTRKCCKLIANKNWLIACTNQVREGQYGEVTPGGKAIPFYSSLRIRVNEIRKVEKKKIVKDKEQKKIIGIESSCYMKKSTVDDPYRIAEPVFIIFGYGIDDIRGNLQWLKTNTKATTYNAVDKDYQSLDAAVAYIEKEGYEETLKEKVIDLWEEIEQHFKTDRKPKVR